MNLKRCDYTAICKQLFLTHISNFTHFSKKKQILFQNSDSTGFRQITASFQCKSDQKEAKQKTKNLKTITKGYQQGSYFQLKIVRTPPEKLLTLFICHGYSGNV